MQTSKTCDLCFRALEIRTAQGFKNPQNAGRQYYFCPGETCKATNKNFKCWVEDWKDRVAPAAPPQSTISAPPSYLAEAEKAERELEELIAKKTEIARKKLLLDRGQLLRSTAAASK